MEHNLIQLYRSVCTCLSKHKPRDAKSTFRGDIPHVSALQLSEHTIHEEKDEEETRTYIHNTLSENAVPAWLLAKLHQISA